MNFLKSTFLLLVFVFTGCSNDDDSNDQDQNNDNSAAQTSQIVEVGTWRITKFIDSGDNETADFNGYSFTFNNGGVLTATNGNETVTGTWSITDDNSSSGDDSSDDDDFNIFFPVPDTNKFEDLNDDWDFVSISNTKIELIDISGGNGGTDELTFEKN